MEAPRIKVTVAPWLQAWLAGYVERCKAAGRAPCLSLMRLMARCAMETR